MATMRKVARNFSPNKFMMFPLGSQFLSDEYKICYQDVMHDTVYINHELMQNYLQQSFV